MSLNREYDEAITEAEKAILMQPGFWMGYLALGATLVYSGNSEKGLEMIKKANSLSPKLPFYEYYFGVVCFNLGQYAEAIALLKKVFLGMHEIFTVNEYLTAAYVLAGMEDEAQKQANEILRIDPNFSVDKFAKSIPYKNQSDSDRILNALRKAGLK
jgi:adenylate cyclase